MLRGALGPAPGRAGRRGLPVPLVPWAAPGAAAPGLVVQAGPVAGADADGARAGVYLRPHSGGLVHLEAPDAAVDLHTPDANCGLGGRATAPGPRVVRGLDDAGVTGYRVCVRPDARGRPVRSSAGCPAPDGSTSR